MDLKLQVNGLNKLLTTVYETKMSLSILLERVGYSPENIEELRRQHLKKIISTHIVKLQEYFSTYQDDKQLYHIIDRYFGLDGNLPETLEALARKLNINLVQIHQLEKAAIARCKKKEWLQQWEGNLYNIASVLLNGNKADKQLSSVSNDNNLQVRRENENLKAELAKIQHTLQSIANSNNLDNKAQIQAQLISAEKENTLLRAQLSKIGEELREAERNFALMQGRSASLRIENKQLQDEIKILQQNQIDLDKYFESQLFNLLKDSAQGNQKFLKMLKRLKVTPNLSVDVGVELEDELRSLLNSDDSQDFFTLITNAQNTNILSKDATALAHAIRTQRNIVVHKRAKESSFLARALLSLFAASLLWPQLPE